MQCTMRPTLSLWASEMPLNASAEAKATAEQTISALQGGHYPWQKGWLKRIPGIYARLLNYLVPYAKTVIAAMFFMVITALTSSMIAVLMGKLTDQGFYAKDVNALWWAPAALIAVALLQEARLLEAPIFCKKSLSRCCSRSAVKCLSGRFVGRQLTIKSTPQVL